MQSYKIIAYSALTLFCNVWLSVLTSVALVTDCTNVRSFVSSHIVKAMWLYY